MCGEDIIAIDGKSLRRSHCRKKGLGPLHMVSAWSTANNLAVLRHIGLGLLKKDTSSKRGIETKRLGAGWNEDYLAKLLFGRALEPLKELMAPLAH